MLSTSAFSQTGTGLTGKYYDATDFVTAVTTRTDASIDFNFGTAIPSGTAITAADTYSIAWSGQIEPAFSELYTFTVTADDAARLWVNDELIVQRMFAQGTGEMRGQMRLKAGHRVNVRLEFIQQTGAASVKLEWASASQAKQVIPTNRMYPTTEIPNGGAVMREVWHGLAGASISTMTSNANYPNKPASREFLTSFECLAQSWEDSFGTRVTGFIRAPVSGSYTFAVSGDEVVQLYLSTDANPANKALIASTTTATAFRDFAANPSQQSAPRMLVAGQRYYVEVLHKEDTGADHWSVAWMKPGDAAFSIIPGTVLMMPGTDLATPSTTNYFNTLATEQPRLGATRERFAWLKQAYLSPTASAAKSRAQWVVSTANSDVANNTRHYGNEIPRMALAWWLTGDSVYPEKVWSNIQGTMSTGDFTVKWKGFTLRQLAYAYDWLYPYWDSTRRTTLLNFLVSSGLNSQTNHYGNNIGILNDSGFIMTALAVGTGNEGAAEPDLSQGVSQLVGKIDQWQPNNGAWLEGTDYGILAKLGLSDGMLSMETALGSTFGVGRNPGFFTARREPLSIASNTRQRFTFSDIGTGSNAAMGWANWWARRFDAPETYDYSRQVGNSTWNALMVPETTISPAQSQLNPDQCFIGPADAVEKALMQHVVTLRQNWTDTKATWVGGMGGTYMSHGMLQSGTFQMSARGVKWFVDLASEGYDVPNHNGTTPVAGADRWDYYRNRAEGHNCLIVNPTSQPDRIWNAPSAPMIAYQSAQNGQRSFAIWDLTNNITGVTKVQRGIQLLGQRKQVLIQDEIVHPTPTTCWWFAHFPNSSVTATISGDGSSVTLTSGTERLWGKIVSGGGVWTVRAALPLPTSPAPAENANNSAYSKLSIQLTSVTNTTLAVWFVPLAPGEVAPISTPSITALNTWNLVLQNEAPIAQNSGANSIGGAPVDVDLRTLVTDDWTPSTQLTFAASGAVGGTVAMQPDGFTARFTPTPAFVGAQSFTFTATDADGGTSNVATIIIGASPVITNWTSTTSGNWSTGANWQGGTAPASSTGADIQFFAGQTMTAGQTVNASNDLAGVTQANKLSFSGAGTSTTVVNVSGNALKLVRNGATSPAITLSGTTAGYRYNIANDIELDDHVSIAANNSGTFVFNGALTGSGGITRTNIYSTLILAGNNSYAGPTTISAGTLQIGNDGASGTLGAGAVTNNGQLRIDRSGSIEVANDISGTGSVLLHCPTINDIVQLTGNNTFTGEVRMTGGSLRITDAAQLGSGTKSVVVDNFNGALRLDGSAGDIELPANFRFSTSNQNGAIFNEAGNNVIEGPVTLAGGGGNTRISATGGSLTINGLMTPNTTGRTLDIRGAGAGIINGNIVDAASPNTLSGISKAEAGKWTLNGSNALTGSTSVTAGTLVINGPHTTSAVTVSAGATLAGRGTINAPITVSGTVAPGDGFGSMQSTSTLSFGSASKVQWELGSNSLAGDQLTSTGAITVTAGAKIDVVLNSPGSETTYLLSFWRTARTFPVIACASLTGSFTLGTVSGDAAGHATATYGAFSLQHTATGVNLIWTPIPGFPIIDEPIVTFTQPTANPAALPNVESRLRITATASGGGTISYAWSVVAGEGGSTGTVTFGNANAADTTALFSEPGTYTLRCTATNEAVSRFADLEVLVAPATTVELQEDLNGYSHRASYLMGNSTAWNHGADPQMRVGRNSSAGQRAVLGFPLDSLPAGSIIRSAKLDVWTDTTSGVGTVGALELRKLTRSFVEGTGDGSASTNGAGSGVTWANYNATTAWTTAGGDYDTSVLSSVAGFDASAPSVQKTFVSSLGLVAAAQAALDADTALELILLSPSTEANTAANNYTNLKSNDHADAAQRPRLTLDFTFNSLPVINPGTVSTAGVGFPLALNGVVTFATSSTWSLVSGPGTASFANASSPTTSVTFSATGSYVLRLTAANDLGEASRDLAVTVASVPDGFAAWQAANWPGVTDLAIIGPNADPDGDGVTNAIEFNAGTNPTSATSVPSFVWNRLASGNWSSAGSWNHGVAPASNAATKIEFFTALNPSGSISANNDIGGGMTLQSLSLNGVGSGSTSISGGALNFASGGALSLNSEGISYAITAPIAFNAATSIGGTSLDALTLSGAISGTGGFTKSGVFDLIVSGGLGGSGLVSVSEGRLRITGPVTSTGNLQASGGILELASNTTGVKQIVLGALDSVVEVNANVTATGLSVPSTGVLSIGDGKTLTLSGATSIGASTGTTLLDVVGATGTLAVSGNTNFYVGAGGTGTGTVDLSGLGTFNANLGTGTLNIGNGSTNSSNAVPWTLILAPTSTITATRVSVGGGFGNTSNASAYTMRMGSGSTVINATDVYVGVYNNQGRGNGNTSLIFDGTAGTLTLRGLAGGTTRANVHVGENNGGSTGTNSGGKFDLSGSASTTLAGGNADLMIGTLNISQRSGGNSDTSSMTFRSGSLNVNTLVVGKAGGSTATGTLTLNGGTVIFNTAATIAQGTGGTTNGTLTIAGAAVTSTPGVVLGNQSGTAVVNATLNLTGGSLTLGGDLSSVGTVTSTLNLNGGTLDLGGNDIVGVTTLTFASGTLKNVLTINATAGLTKTGAGILTLDGTMGYSGTTTISAGTLRVGAATGTNTATSLATSSSIVNEGTLILRRTDAADVDITPAISGAGSVSFEGNGTSNQSRYTMNNASTYSGGSTVTNARINLTNATGLGSGSVIVNSGASVFINGAGTVANAFSIAGNGWTETSGQLGALRLSSGSTLTGAITLTANARITANTGATATISGPISGAFALEVGEDTTAGAINLNGSHTYTGSTTISFGTLNLGGTLTSNLINNATLAPQGTPSTSGSLTNNNTYRVRLNAGSNDRLTVGTNVTLAGTLDLVPAVGLTAGTSFTILTQTSAVAISGTFTSRAQNGTWTENGYLWQISYTGGDGNDVVVTIMTPPAYDSWLTNYPTLNGNNALSTADPDGDGVTNLMEYATAMNPTGNDTVPVAVTLSGNTLEFIYTKNKAATDVTFVVEWSDDLVSWSTVGVTSSVLTDNGTTQQIKATMPAGTNQRFAHLKVSKP